MPAACRWLFSAFILSGSVQFWVRLNLTALLSYATKLLPRQRLC
jgi:hypothetical protein